MRRAARGWRSRPASHGKTTAQVKTAHPAACHCLICMSESTHFGKDIAPCPVCSCQGLITEEQLKAEFRYRKKRHLHRSPFQWALGLSQRVYIRLRCAMVWAVFLLQLANGTQQSLDGFMLQFNKNAHGVAPTSQVHTFSVCSTISGCGYPFQRQDASTDKQQAPAFSNPSPSQTFACVLCITSTCDMTARMKTDETLKFEACGRRLESSNSNTIRCGDLRERRWSQSPLWGRGRPPALRCP